MSLSRSLLLSLLILPASLLRADDFSDSFGGKGASGSASATSAAGGIHIVGMDQSVPSRKRGVCMNELSAEDFKALSPGVSWYYNWFYRPKNPEAAGSMEFFPMAWADRPDDISGLKSYLASHHPRAVLGINEPNLRGQAFIPPEQTAKLYTRIKEISDQYHLPLVAPNMALGSPSGDSITAEDPITHTKTTYTFMVPFLKAMDYYLNNAPFAALSLHSYGDIGELKWAVDTMHKTFNCPIWVTEFACWKSSDDAAEEKYLTEAVDFLERTPYVEGYAWFKERVKGNNKLSLLASNGQLTPLGQLYVSLPTHDSTVYYRLPGQLPAANFVTGDADMRETSDSGAKYQMACTAAGSLLTYNIQVDNPGAYKVDFRVAGAAGKLDILSGTKLLASVPTPQQNEWNTVSTSLTLPAGPQQIAIRYAASGQCLHWIQFGH